MGAPQVLGALMNAVTTLSLDERLSLVSHKIRVALFGNDRPALAVLEPLMDQLLEDKYAAMVKP